MQPSLDATHTRRGYLSTLPGSLQLVGIPGLAKLKSTYPARLNTSNDLLKQKTYPARSLRFFCFFLKKITIPSCQPDLGTVTLSNRYEATRLIAFTDYLST